MNWANRLTVMRIILVPVFIAALLYIQLEVALLVFILAAITDALDGYIARVRKEKTKLGAVMDPLADKILVGSAFLSFSIISGLPEYLKMPIYVPVIVISRDVIILIGISIIYFLTGKVEIKPTFLGKMTTFLQMLTLILVLLKFKYSNVFWNLTAAATVISGLDYIRIGAKQTNNGQE